MTSKKYQWFYKCLLHFFLYGMSCCSVELKGLYSAFHKLFCSWNFALIKGTLNKIFQYQKSLNFMTMPQQEAQSFFWNITLKCKFHYCIFKKQERSLDLGRFWKFSIMSFFSNISGEKIGIFLLIGFRC